jgi:hypothetical protein
MECNGSTTAQIGNVCTGVLTVTVVDSIGCSTSLTQYVFSDTVLVVDSSFTVSSFSNMVSLDGNCDGSVNVYPSMSTGNYTYLLSNGMSSTTGYFDSLCAGIYSVYVYNSAGDTVTNDFIVSNPSNNFTTTNYMDSVFVDSLMSDLQVLCNIMYGTIDSVFISGYTISGDSITVNWLVLNGTTATSTSETYVFNGVSGIYQYGLMVYCPGKSLGNYFTAHDQIFVSTSLGIAENQLTDVSIFPNPATEFVSIQFPSVGNYQIRICDITGRTLISSVATNQSSIQIPFNEMASGKYVVTITSNEYSISKSLMK